MINLEEVAFNLISTAGDARSDCMLAFMKAKKGEISEAKKLLETAKEKLTSTHKIHAEIIQKEASGEKLDFSLLILHSEDHFMTANTMIEMAEFIIDLYDRLPSKK